MQTTKEKKQWTFTGWHMLIITLSFFAIIIGVNSFMAFSAVKSWTGLVVKNTYVASQEYNTKLATSRLQHSLGWNSSVKFEKESLIFSLKDKNNITIDAKQVDLQVNRVVGVDGELQLILTKDKSGNYSAPAKLDSGIWNVFIKAKLADESVFEQSYQIKLEK